MATAEESLIVKVNKDATVTVPRFPSAYRVLVGRKFREPDTLDFPKILVNGVLETGGRVHRAMASQLANSPVGTATYRDASRNKMT